MAKAKRSATQPILTPVEFARQESGREIAAKLEWLMLFRVLMVTVLLGAAILSSADTVASLSQPFHLFLYGIIIITYGLTLGYAVAVRRVRDVQRFALIQLAGDVIVSACLVHMTGGTESVFTFLFSLSIINGAILLYRPGALAVATFSSAAFLLIGAHEAGWLQLPQLGPRPPRTNLYYVTFIHLTTFYLVAILASYLAEQLRSAGKEIAEKTLSIAELRALNDNIVSSLSSGLVTIDHSGRIISCNEGAARITGHAQADVLMRPVGEVFEELDDVFTFSDDLAGASRRLETSFTRHDNNARIIMQYRVSPLRGHDGRVFGKVVHFEDATQIHALESAVKRHERLAAVGELAAAIAHEIRNPLASISGSVELLASMGGASEPQTRLRDIVLRETERLNGLITDFLRYARPRSPDPVSTDMGTVVRETVDAFNQELAERGSAVVVAIEDPGGSWASADGGQVRQVLWNLLHNAANAMPHGGRVTTRLERRATVQEDDEAEDLWIHVQDEGPGVAKAIRDRIFEPFYTTRKEGTGLGLAISQRIMQDHDGDLLLECPEEGGSVFSMRLRATEPAIQEAVA